LVGKLVLKIPWKNIYSAPVEASIEGLFLLAVPIEEVEYDPSKEEKRMQEAKKTELQRVEDKKKEEREKGEMGIIVLCLIRVSCHGGGGGGGGGGGDGVAAAVEA
jgi:hypothetical protein